MCQPSTKPSERLRFLRYFRSKVKVQGRLPAKSRQGFTFIELSVGVALLIIAGVSLSRYFNNLSAAEKAADSGQQFSEVADELLDSLYIAAKNLRSSGSCSSANMIVSGLANGSFQLTQVSSVTGPGAAFTAMNTRCAAGQSSALSTLNTKRVYYGCYRLQPLSDFGELSKMTIFAEVVVNFKNLANESSISCNTFVNPTAILPGVKTMVNLLWFKPNTNGAGKSMPIAVTRAIP